MNLREELKNLVSKMQNEVPLVHNITNYVTVNDCANAVLAIGASPIMADDNYEVEDITSISKALVINIGTLNKRTVESMILAGKKANELNIPVVLDPVGAGASSLRNETTSKILKQVKVNIIRGNMSEISFICGLDVSTNGVDSADEDNKNDAVMVAKTVAEKYKCTAADYFIAAIAGISSMAIAGEMAYEKAGSIGTGSFHIAVINGLSNINAKLFGEMIKFEEV